MCEKHSNLTKVRHNSSFFFQYKKILFVMLHTAQVKSFQPYAKRISLALFSIVIQLIVENSVGIKCSCLLYGKTTFSEKKKNKPLGILKKDFPPSGIVRL